MPKKRDETSDSSETSKEEVATKKKQSRKKTKKSSTESDTTSSSSSEEEAKKKKRKHKKRETSSSEEESSEEEKKPKRGKNKDSSEESTSSSEDQRKRKSKKKRKHKERETSSSEEESSEEEKKPKRGKNKDSSEESTSSSENRRKRKSKKKKHKRRETSSSEEESSEEEKKPKRGKNKDSSEESTSSSEDQRKRKSKKKRKHKKREVSSSEEESSEEEKKPKRGKKKDSFEESSSSSDRKSKKKKINRRKASSSDSSESSSSDENKGKRKNKPSTSRQSEDYKKMERKNYDRKNNKTPVALGNDVVDVNTISTDIPETSQKLSPKKEQTIVLIGGSRCGKSTLINSFNNYFRYSTFDRVQDRGVKVCIPTRFSWFIGDKQKTIQPKMTKASGDEGNEDLEGGGRSVTQEPMIHTFKYKGLLGDVPVNFIDTPGMSDIDGDEKDGDHIENIMKYLEKLEKIDAICMVLKPNESKLAYSFRSAINKLLDRLPKTTYSNILLCFTYTNDTNFKPSETLPVLRKYFTETGRNISLKKENVFCFDNEPFRYLCLVKTYPNEMDETYADTCRKTYAHSVGELTRLIEFVEKLPSFKFKNLLPQQIKGLALRLKECSNISEPRKQNVPQSNELSKEPSAYPKTTGLFSIEETKKNQQDIVHRQASPPQDTRKEEVISKKEQAPITSEEFATTYDLNKGGVELFDLSAIAINIYPSPHIAHQIYTDIPKASRVVPTHKVEDNQPGSSTFAKDQNIEEVEIDAREMIATHPIYELTKERTFDLVQALAKELARIVEDNISRSYFLTEDVKSYTTQKEEKEKSLYPFCEDCHGIKCPASSFAFGICRNCTHDSSKHHYTSSEADKEKIRSDIRKLTSKIDEKKKELAKLETLQDIIQTACVQFSIFRLTQINNFFTTFINYILDTADKEKRKASMRETSIRQKDFSEIYSISLKSFVDVFQDRLAKATSEGYDKEVTQKSVTEQILQLSEQEDFKNILLPIINEKIY